MENNTIEITSIVSEIERILPQLASFINTFHSSITTTKIQVITDGSGNLSMMPPHGMSPSENFQVSTRIGIIDRLILEHSSNLEELFQKGFSLEKTVKSTDAAYNNSQLAEQYTKYKTLRGSYNH
ncbi:MAG: hypothetical protein H9W82_00875 [Lactobacillus sp.]|nr:hypothetical protein [Lactobacillus sp.]